MRRQAIEKHRQQRGGRVLAVLPIHYPKEILTAMNVLAVEVWGPPGPPRGHQAGRIQVYVCSVVRNALAFLADGPSDLVDGILYPSTCDSITGLATLLPDMGRWDKATIRFTWPMSERRTSAERFLEAELERLATQIEQLTGQSLDAERLTWAIELHRRIDQKRVTLVHKRAYLELSDAQLYTLLRQGEYLWPEDYLDALEQALGNLSSEPVERGIPLMISGLVPEPMAIFEAIENAGGTVVADDYAGIGRRIVSSPPPRVSTPLKRLVDLVYAAPPCPTRTTDMTKRLGYLQRLYQRSNAAGLIIHATKFCEPELFDVPSIRRFFAQKGWPVLYLESELETDLSKQHITRLQAFVEMISNRGADA